MKTIVVTAGAYSDYHIVEILEGADTLDMQAAYKLFCVEFGVPSRDDYTNKNGILVKKEYYDLMSAAKDKLRTRYAQALVIEDWDDVYIDGIFVHWLKEEFKLKVSDTAEEFRMEDY